MFSRMFFGSLLRGYNSRKPLVFGDDKMLPYTKGEEWGEDEDWGGEDEWGEDDDWGGGDNGAEDN